MKYKKVAGNGETIYYAICGRCERVLDHVGSLAQKYCPGCKVIVDRDKSRERMRKYRKKNKNS